MPVSLTDHGALTSLNCCPSLNHLIACGYQQGSIAFWDIRHPKIPAALIDAHKGPVWQVKFHPVYPDRLFTCSNDGELWICDASKLRRPDLQISFQSQSRLGADGGGAGAGGAGSGIKIPWLLGDTALKNADDCRKSKISKTSNLSKPQKIFCLIFKIFEIPSKVETCLFSIFYSILI